MSKFKYVIVNTPKGQYQILAESIALDRVRYYSKPNEYEDGFEQDGDEWKEEWDYTMSNEFELIDWLLNNSDWEDWNGLAQQINDDVLVSTKDFWTSSDHFSVVEK